MSKDDLFGHLDEDIEEEDDSSENKFKDNFKELDVDIDHIDLKLQGIQGHISTLESNIPMIQQAINTARGTNSDVGKLYAGFNKMYELLSFFQKSYQVYLDLKYKYRTEQNGLKYKLLRLDEIDKKKINELDGLNYNDVISAMGKLLADPNKKDKMIQDMESDPKYKI
jgi:hypothetical protein